MKLKIKWIYLDFMISSVFLLSSLFNPTFAREIFRRLDRIVMIYMNDITEIVIFLP